MNKWIRLENVIGDCMIIAFGVILAFIFITIEIVGWVGHEENQYILWVEILLSIPVIILGCRRFKRDVW